MCKINGESKLPVVYGSSELEEKRLCADAERVVGTKKW